MINLTKEDLVAVTQRTGTVVDTIFDDYEEVERTLVEGADDFLTMGGLTEGLVTPNPFMFFFEYKSTCLRVTYPKGSDSVMDLAMVQDHKEKLVTIASLALTNVDYLEGPDGERLMELGFWEENSTLFGFEPKLDDDGSLVLDVLVKATIIDYPYDEIVAMLNTMQYLVFIADHLIAREVEKTTEALANGGV